MGSTALEPGTEHDITVLTTSSVPDVDDHAAAVDIRDLQVNQFGASCPRTIEGHQ